MNIHTLMCPEFWDKISAFFLNPEFWDNVSNSEHKGYTDFYTHVFHGVLWYCFGEFKKVYIGYTLRCFVMFGVCKQIYFKFFVVIKHFFNKNEVVLDTWQCLNKNIQSFCCVFPGVYNFCKIHFHSHPHLRKYIFTLVKKVYNGLIHPDNL